MYGKIFESMYEGTLYGQWEALVTMQQLIVLADKEGFVDMTPPALSARTSIPLKIIEKGLEILSKPDPYSRTAGDDGVRIKLIDNHRPWGWYIVNYAKYRDMASQEDRREYMREYMRERRAAEKEGQPVNTCKQSVNNGKSELAVLAHTDVDADVNVETKKKGQSTASFDRFWEVYPKKRKKKNAREIWKRKKLDPQADHLIADVLGRLEGDDRWKAGYIPDPTTYLNQERWDDEMTDSSGKKLTYAQRMKQKADEIEARRNADNEP